MVGELLKEFQVIHICGKKNVDESLKGTPGYVQYGYVSEELKDLFATADIVISRAGANAICELLALRKPALLIPLSAAASRGDQLLNAESFRKQGFSDVLQEEEITDEVLLARIHHLYEAKEEYRTAMEKSNLGNAVQTIVELLDSENLEQKCCHPYTKALLNSIFDVYCNQEAEIHLLEGDPPSPLQVQAGCAFASRCPRCREKCLSSVPELKRVEEGHLAACFYPEN